MVKSNLVLMNLQIECENEELTIVLKCTGLTVEELKDENMFSTRNIRIASDAERIFYQHTLYPLQDHVCRLAGKAGGLYLSGGTGLSRAYFNHRYSDDLDFFYNGHLHPKENFHVEVHELIERIAANFTVEPLVTGDFFNRIIVKDQKTTLKVEFIYNPHPHIGKCVEWNGCLVDSVENIGANKITKVQDRKTSKDFVDLYFLLQKLRLEQLVNDAQKKIVPLDYENTLLAFSDHYLEGTAIMIMPLEPEEMNRFGSELVRKLIAHARTI